MTKNKKPKSFFDLKKKSKSNIRKDSDVNAATFDYVSPLKWSLDFQLSDEHFERLKGNIKEAENDNKNAKPRLAGGISKSIFIDPESIDWFVREIFVPIINSNDLVKRSHDDTIAHALKSLSPPPGVSVTPYMETCWVNYQKKHEFNPRHNHSGMFSFVIWIKIPYDYEDEKKLPLAESSGAAKKLIGNFSFLWSDGLDIQTKVIPMSPKMEAHGVIFPSTFHHEVYPFYTSDEERISVSGNIVYLPEASHDTDTFDEDDCGLEGQ